MTNNEKGMLDNSVTTKIKENLRKMLNNWMTQKELTRERAVEKLGVEVSTLGSWLNSRNQVLPRIQQLVKIARELRVSLDELCGEYSREEYVAGGSITWEALRRPKDPEDDRAIQIFQRIVNGETPEDYESKEVEQALRRAIYSDLIVIRDIKDLARVSDLAEGIRDTYKQRGINLIDTRVVSVEHTSSDQFKRFTVGWAAKNYFLDHMSRSNIKTIGLAGGETLRCMVKAIRPEEKLAPISVYPIHVCPDIGNLSVDANTLAGGLIAQHEDDGVTGMALQSLGFARNREPNADATVDYVLRRVSTADMIFMGVGVLGAKRKLYFGEDMLGDILRQLNLAEKTLLEEGALGDIAYHIIRDDGQLPPSWEEADKWLCSIPLDTLHSMATQGGCRVIAMASDKEKDKVLHAAIEAGYINVLIIGDGLAESLLELASEDKN